MYDWNRIGVAGLVIAISALGSVGCADNGAKATRVQHVEGTARNIDMEKKLVSMSIRNEHGEERIVEGTITDSTEVVINGAQRKIEDVVPGDRVVAHYSKREGEGDTGRIFVSKVEVSRPDDRDWKSTENARTVSDREEPATAATNPPAKPAATTEPARSTPPSQTPTTAAAAPVKPMEPITISRDMTPPPAQDQRVPLEAWIYGMLRFNMEVAVESRSQLLKDGVPASDARLTKHETVIRRARKLLVDHGEIVEDVTPPLPPQTDDVDD